MVGKPDTRYPGEPPPTRIELHNLQIRNADFTGATLGEIHFHKCDFENCKFDQCSISNVSFWSGCNMRNCSFDGATIVGQASNEIDFSDCSFVKTKWKGRYNFFNSVHMTDCVFEGSFKTFDFGGAIMKNVKLKGSFYDVTFHGWQSLKSPHPRLTRPGDSTAWLETPFDMVPNKMDSVDFSEANLRMTNLQDYCYLDRCVLPPIMTHCVFRKSTEMLMEVKTQLEETFSKQHQVKVREALYRRFYIGANPHPTTPHAICNVEDCMEGVDAEAGRKLFEIVVATSERLGARVQGSAPKR
jgi:uncharacterized protein YjbI with pentapeptide repeats